MDRLRPFPLLPSARPLELRPAEPLRHEAMPSNTSGTPGVSPELARQAQAAAEKFEGFFITQMLRQMRSSARQIAGESGMFRDRVNDDMLDLADTMVADAMAGQRAFGIADLILRQVLPAPQPVATTPVLNAEPAPVALEQKVKGNTP